MRGFTGEGDYGFPFSHTLAHAGRKLIFDASLQFFLLLAALLAQLGQEADFGLLLPANMHGAQSKSLHINVTHAPRTPPQLSKLLQQFFDILLFGKVMRVEERLGAANGGAELMHSLRKRLL